MDVPVFIVNRNRVSGLRRLIPWLLEVGVSRITILDNASTYPPLAEYYRREMPSEVAVQYLGANLGPWMFWESGMHRRMSTNYIVTDSDVAPADFCPRDLLARLGETLREFPEIAKAGPGIRIDNIPTQFALRDMVIEHESQFWKRPTGRGGFFAGIDSTFAMYRPNTGFVNDPDRNVRLDAPYLFEHLPWYENSGSRSEEEAFYLRSIDRNLAIHWSKLL